MKKNIIIQLLTIFLSIISLNAQESFYSKSDVLSYLSANTFKNNEINVTITFSNMGAYLNVNGRIVGLNPEIYIRNSKSVIIRYYSKDNYNSNLTFLLEGNTGSIVDANNKRVYSRYNMYSEISSKKDNDIKYTEEIKESSSKQNNLYNKSWAKSQAEKKGANYKAKTNGDFLRRLIGNWADIENNNFMVIEQYDNIGFQDFHVYLFIEYSEGNRISHLNNVAGMSPPKIETIYLGTNTKGEHLFDNQLIFSGGNVEIIISENQIDESILKPKIDVRYGNFKSSFTLTDNESNLKRISELKSAKDKQ